MPPGRTEFVADMVFPYATLGHLLNIPEIGFRMIGESEYAAGSMLYLKELDVVLFGEQDKSLVSRRVGDGNILKLIAESMDAERLTACHATPFLMFAPRAVRPSVPIERDVAICVVDSGISAASTLRVAEKISFADGAADCDETGHGTLVAHAIADPNPLSPYSGLAFGARLFIAKVDDGRGTLRPESRLLRALNWAIAKKIEVVNLSIGYDRSPGDPFRSTTILLSRFASKNQRPIFVAAAGNGFCGVSDPAAANGVVAVAGARGIEHENSQCIPDAMIQFSANSAGFYCQGYNSDFGCGSVLGIESFGGTSAACAIGTSLIARIIARSPNASIADVLDEMAAHALNPNGWNQSIGGFGIVGPFV